MKIDRTIPSDDVIADNLRTRRAAASAGEIVAGREWYPTANILAADLADEAFDITGDPVSVEFAAAVLAAFSQNSTWSANVTLARKYLAGGCASGGGLPDVLAELAEIETGTSPADALGALKRPDFWRNIVGEHQFVTSDRWHLRAAFALDELDATDGYATRPGWCQRTRSKKTAPWQPCVKLTETVRDAVTAATRIVAAEFGESPAECQAVIWCHVRGSAI